MMTRIGQYEISGLLGQGGIGRVYIGKDTVLGREVAIKSLRPELVNDENFVERFRAEATSLAKLNHPNITTLYALLSEGGSLHMVMEVVRGATIESILAKNGGRLDEATALDLIAQAGEGLAYAHAAGVIHRDIKPSNLMVTDAGRLKIMDFGIARVQGAQRLTRDGNIVGTLAYMAPEQLKGAQGDQRSDVYSLAIVLYEMLTGAPPFRADTDYDLMQAQINQAPVRPSKVTATIHGPVEAAILKALEKNPDKRFADVRGFIDALGGGRSMIAGKSTPLAELISGTRAGVAATQPGNRSGGVKTARPTLSGPVKGVLAGGIAALVLFGAFVLWSDGIGGRPETAGGSFETASRPQEPSHARMADIAQTTPRPDNGLFPNMRGTTVSSTAAGAPARGTAASDETASNRATKLIETAAAGSGPGNSASFATESDFGDAEIAYRDGDFQKALSIALPLAQSKDDAEAQFLVAKIYEFGRGGIDKNLPEAFRWYRRAGAKGHAKAQYRVGAFYQLGLGGIAVDLQKALDWYGRAAASGDIEATWFLAVMYNRGEGMAQNDLRKALELFTRVAQSRSPRANDARKNIDAINAALKN